MTDLSDAALRELVEAVCTEHTSVYTHWGELPHILLREFIALRDAARAEQRETDIKAVCWYCHTARLFTTDSNTYHVGLDIDREPIAIHCAAAPIRREMEQT